MNRRSFRFSLVIAVIALAIAAVAAVLLGLGPPEAEQREGTFSGFCEASSILSWQGGYLVGDNETEDRLFVFTADLAPRAPRKLSSEVEDIEALAATPEGVLVVGSQGANKRGERRSRRERVLLDGHGAITPDLSGCPPCVAVRSRPPKRGGLSVEGAAHWNGSIWLGLRSPLVDGQAIVLRMDGDPRVALGVAEMTMLDLGGFGVRELTPWRDGLLVLAGPADDAGSRHRVYFLSSPGSAPERLPVELPNGTEGLAPAPDGRFVLVRDGDGRPGRSCRTPATWTRIVLPLPPG
jgi:hypothetical protein